MQPRKNPIWTFIAFAEVVGRYLALYDKTCLDYHRRDIKNNYWNFAAVELEIEPTNQSIKHIIFPLSFHNFTTAVKVFT